MQIPLTQPLFRSDDECSQHKLRGWLQRGVNRLFYGQRDEPYAVVSRLSQRLEATLAPDALLPAVVETVAQALKRPYAALVLKEGEQFTTAASYGTPTDDALKLPLVYQAEPMGDLLLAKPGRLLTGACWTNWPATLAEPHMPCGSQPNSSAPIPISWPHASGW